MDGGCDDAVFINLRINKNLRSSFKQTTKKEGVSMQAILLAFVRSYVKSPRLYRLILDVDENVTSGGEE